MTLMCNRLEGVLYNTVYVLGLHMYLAVFKEFSATLRGFEDVPMATLQMLVVRSLRLITTDELTEGGAIDVAVDEEFFTHLQLCFKCSRFDYSC